MIDQELKKKILNTISTYETKCDKLQLHINALKNTINQLIITPIGIHYDIDEKLSQFRTLLDEDFDPIVLEKKVNNLANLLVQLEKKKKENTRSITGLIGQCVESVNRIATRASDKRAITKLQKLLETEVEHHTILIHFNEVLTQCISSVNKELEELQTSKDKSNSQISSQISLRVNDSLQQLLNHLSIPKDLDLKKDHIKTSLSDQLSSDMLSKIIDGLTELVVDAFNIEQNRFKGFLQQLTNQLYDFDVYLKATSNIQKKASTDSLQLEHGIQDNINQIKDHIDSSKTIEELAEKVNQHLEIIGSRIKEYRVKETKREKLLEKKVKELQAKLSDSEQSAEEIKNLLSFQKYKINHDSLTSLPNRESYEEHILEAFQQYKRTGRTLSLAVCDIDRFKRINDTFGHLAGDKILKKVAELLRNSLRSVDFIARVGGEEFVIMFDQVTTQTAYPILEKLRKIIEECQFYYREHKVDVTVSFGLTSIQEGDDAESLFMRADNAMYHAKNSGRNRVEVLS